MGTWITYIETSAKHKQKLGEKKKWRWKAFLHLFATTYVGPWSHVIRSKLGRKNLVSFWNRKWKEASLSVATGRPSTCYWTEKIPSLKMISFFSLRGGTSSSDGRKSSKEKVVQEICRDVTNIVMKSKKVFWRLGNAPIQQRRTIVSDEPLYVPVQSPLSLR